MTTDLDLRIYGHFPAICSPVEARGIKAIKQKRLRQGKRTSRDECMLLPWAMDDLPGTTWRNVHTYSLVIIESIRENRYGLLGPDPDTWINSMFAIGLWWDERFVIDHWVRVDHLDSDVQLDWYIAANAYCRSQIYRAEEALQKQRASQYDSCHTANVNQRSLDVKRKMKEGIAAMQQMTDFADAHNITLTPQIINAGIVAQNKTAQTRMF